MTTIKFGRADAHILGTKPSDDRTMFLESPNLKNKEHLPVTPVTLSSRIRSETVLRCGNSVIMEHDWAEPASERSGARLRGWIASALRIQLPPSDSVDEKKGPQLRTRHHQLEGPAPPLRFRRGNNKVLLKLSRALRGTWCPERECKMLNSRTCDHLRFRPCPEPGTEIARIAQNALQV